MHNTQMERYLEWKNLITKETRPKLSDESLKDYYNIRNWLAIKALAELSK